MNYIIHLRKYCHSGHNILNISKFDISFTDTLNRSSTQFFSQVSKSTNYI